MRCSSKGMNGRMRPACLSESGPVTSAVDGCEAEREADAHPAARDLVRRDQAAGGACRPVADSNGPAGRWSPRARPTCRSVNTEQRHPHPLSESGGAATRHQRRRRSTDESAIQVCLGRSPVVVEDGVQAAAVNGCDLGGEPLVARSRIAAPTPAKVECGAGPLRCRFPRAGGLAARRLVARRARAARSRRDRSAALCSSCCSCSRA